MVTPGLDTPRLLATEDDELWLVDEKGVWYRQSGTLTDELDWTAKEKLVREVALGTDGGVWVAGPDGIAYRDGGGGHPSTTALRGRSPSMAEARCGSRRSRTAA